MRGIATLMAAAALVAPSMAHYRFTSLVVNGNHTGEYEYVRQNSNINSPVTDVNSTDIVCNAGALSTGNQTSTYTVKAGDTVGFDTDIAIIHPGPLQAYLSKAPDGTTAAEYDGSGDWFKIYELGFNSTGTSGLTWAASDKQNFTWTLPEDTPAGQYLLRVEHVALHGASTLEGAQFYISCAQIEVTDGGSVSPSPVTQFPGAYTGEEPGLLINIYYPVPENYTFAGPTVWPSSNTDESGEKIEVIDGSDVEVAATGGSSAVVSSGSAAATATTAAASVASSAVSSVVASSSAVVSSVATSSAVASSISTNAAVVASSSAACEKVTVTATAYETVSAVTTVYAQSSSS